MSRRESLLLRIVLIVLLAAAALLYYQRLYYPQICQERSSVQISDIALLIAELQSFHACIRSAAALDLQKTGKDGEPAIPYLLKTAEDKDDSVRWRSIAALGHIGIVRPEIKETVLRHLKDANQTTVYNSIFALKDYPSHETVKGLISVLNHPWEDVRFRAAQDIPWMLDKDRDRELLPELSKRLQALQSDSSDKVRSRASWSLSQVQRSASKPSEGQAVAGNEIEKQFLISEFDHLVSSGQRSLQSTARSAKARLTAGLAAQYQELEKGLAVLKQDPTGADAQQFLCWLKGDLNRYSFQSLAFTEDFQELKSLLEKANLQSPCAGSASEAVNDILLNSNSFIEVSFQCPRVSPF